jgi:hypothetical protein
MLLSFGVAGMLFYHSGFAPGGCCFIYANRQVDVIVGIACVGQFLLLIARWF